MKIYKMTKNDWSASVSLARAFEALREDARHARFTRNLREDARHA